MLVSKTPYRISFFSGGTDYPGWYREHGGAVLATSIDKYCYISCRNLPPFFEHKFRVVWSKIESCKNIHEIEHPAVRNALQYFDVNQGIEIHHIGDLPARSGMGSSSSFTVGLLHALYANQGQMPTKHQLAMKSIHLEQNIIKENVGSQDQVAAAYGGLNYISFSQTGEISVRPLTISAQRRDSLDRHLMLFYTGIKRTAADVALSYTQDLSGKKRQLRILRDLTEESVELLASSNPISQFGELLHEAWQVKSSLSSIVSNKKIASIYDAARASGALGGKILGAGGGGFLLLFAKPEDQPRIQKELNQYIHVPFKFESSGSQITFYSEDIDYSSAERIKEQQSLKPFKELKELNKREKVPSAA